MTATAAQVAVGVTAIVCANAAVSLVYVRRRGVGIESAAARFAALLVLNLGLVLAASRILADGENFPFWDGLLFAYLIALVLWLYDRFRPVYDARFERAGA